MGDLGHFSDEPAWLQTAGINGFIQAALALLGDVQRVPAGHDCPNMLIAAHAGDVHELCLAAQRCRDAIDRNVIKLRHPALAGALRRLALLGRPNAVAGFAVALIHSAAP